jgi:hypothetical protein
VNIIKNIKQKYTRFIDILETIDSVPECFDLECSCYREKFEQGDVKNNGM